MRVFIYFILMLLSSNVYAEIDSFILKVPGQNQIKISRDDLERLPTHSITTSTNYTLKDTFIGVKVRDFLQIYGVVGKNIRAFAWDSYSYTIPIDEAVKYDAIIAYKKGGRYMSVAELGPVAIIYPRDNNPELEQLSVDAKTVWQIKMLDIK